MDATADIDHQAIADELLDAHERAATVAPIAARTPGFDEDAAYVVLDRIAARRRRDGWRPVGRKLGFTNRTIWALFNVDRPFWAHVWAETVQAATDNMASVSVSRLVQPRIEPEVVFGLRGPVPVTDDPIAVLAGVAWMAPGFEVVQCPFPDWSFTLPDCIAAFGLHGTLVVGTRVAVTGENREEIAARLPAFELTLRRHETVVDRGTGANVLDSPALALTHLARVLDAQASAPPVEAGEIVTTGTITGAWPVAAGEEWSSDYGTLGLDGLTISLT